MSAYFGDEDVRPVRSMADDVAEHQRWGWPLQPWHAEHLEATAQARVDEIVGDELLWPRLRELVLGESRGSDVGAPVDCAAQAVRERQEEQGRYEGGDGAVDDTGSGSNVLTRGRSKATPTANQDVRVPASRLDYECARPYLRQSGGTFGMAARVCYRGTCRHCAFGIVVPKAVELAVAAGLVNRVLVAPGDYQNFRRRSSGRLLPVDLGNGVLAVWCDGLGVTDVDLLRADMTARSGNIVARVKVQQLQGSGFKFGLRYALLQTTVGAGGEEDCILMWARDVDRVTLAAALDRHATVASMKPRRWDLPTEDATAWETLEDVIGLHWSCDSDGRRRALVAHARWREVS